MKPDGRLMTTHDDGRGPSAAADAETVARRGPGARQRWLIVPAGAVAGAVLGAIARGWMRWISEDPEFTWAGTMFIVGAFTVFAAAQATTAVARTGSARPGAITASRCASAVLSLGLFAGAGVVMLPTVLFGSLAVWRTSANRVLPVVLAALAMPSVVLVIVGIADDHGWGIGALGMMLLFVCIYAAIIGATWPTVAPVPERWRPSRRVVGAAAIIGVSLIGWALYQGGIQ